METIHHVIEWAAFGIEMLAVAVIVATVVIMAVTRGTNDGPGVLRSRLGDAHRSRRWAVHLSSGYPATVAAIFAIRAGWRDAREGRPPYLWSVFTHAATRRDLLRQGWADVGKVFIVAVVLDLTYELFAYRWVYPGQALIVAAVLAFIPYLLIRGPVNRIARRFIRP